MHDPDETGRAGTTDRVEKAVEDSFPASDPPSWTATRAGKPESKTAKLARKGDAPSPPEHCEALGLFATETSAKAAADALLAAGFNMVNIGPPCSQGNLGAGIGASANKGDTVAASAALGALAAGALAALFGGGRGLFTMAAGGAIGAISAHTAAQIKHKKLTGQGWPDNGVVLCVRLKSPQDQERAVQIIERQGAQKLHVSWAHAR